MSEISSENKKKFKLTIKSSENNESSKDDEGNESNSNNPKKIIISSKENSEKNKFDKTGNEEAKNSGEIQYISNNSSSKSSNPSNQSEEGEEQEDSSMPSKKAKKKKKKEKISRSEKVNSINASKKNQKVVEQKTLTSPHENDTNDEDTMDKAKEGDEEEEIEKKTLRQIFDKFFTNKRLSYLNLIVGLTSLFSFIFYCVCTYFLKLFKIMNYLDLLILFIYFSFYFIELTLTHHRFIYVFSLDSFLQILTMIPFFLAFFTDDYLDNYLYMFVNCCRVLRFLRVSNAYGFFRGSEENNVSKQIMMIINTILNMIFVISGLMQIFERQEIQKLLLTATEPLNILNLKMRKYYHHYLYYTIVTISTVGFGDISPYTILGKSIFIILVFLVLIVVPCQISDLITLLGAQSDYARKSYSSTADIPHILLVGDISTDSLKSFCQEFFHPDHGAQYRHVVILNTLTPPRDLEIYLQEPENENFIFYLEGDPLNEKDLLRADVHKAKACIIFNDKNSKDPYSGDHQSLFLGIFIKKFVFNYNKDKAKNLESLSEILEYTNPNFHLCLQLNKPESFSHFYNSLQPVYKKCMKQDQLIVIESLKMNLLSKSCLTPGIMALVTNLVMTAGDVDETNEDEWMKEYSEGRGHEIYRIQLKEYYHQFTFLEAVENIYNQGQVIAFALEIEINETSIIKLNPSNCGDMTLGNLIEKGKEFYAKKKKQNSNSNSKFSPKGNDNIPLSGSGNRAVEGFNSTYTNCANQNQPKNKVKLYAYLICSDKSEADTVANKEKEKGKGSEKNGRKVIRINSNRKPTLGLTRLERKEGTLINPEVSKTIQPSSSINKDIYKDFMQGIASNINLQMNIHNNNEDSSSESEEEDSENESMVLFGSVAMEISSKDYHIIDNPEQRLRTNIDIMHHSIKDREDISHHIVICGLHPALLHFILPLRAKYLQEEALKWIVILAPSLPQSLFEAFSRFNRIIFIQGSPLLPENLFRANIVNADKAVILSSGESKVSHSLDGITMEMLKKGDKNSYSDEQMLDAETIFIYKALKKCNKNIQVMTELVCTNNIEYLLSTTNLQQLYNQNGNYSEYEYTPLYASGEVFTPSIIDSLTCQSYFNPHIVTIIEMLLGGQKINTEVKVKRLEDFYSLINSNLYLIKVPETQVNEAFAEFYYFLLRHHSIAIALYRKNTKDGFYYVYTNPRKTTLLREHDFVFVLSNNTNIIEVIGERLMINEEDNNNLSLKEVSSSESENEEEEVSYTKSSEDDSKNKDIHNRSGLSDYKNIYNSVKNDAKNRNMQNNPKNIQFEKIQDRLDKIQTDLQGIKDEFDEFPDYIEKTVDKELDNEMNVYLYNQ